MKERNHSEQGQVLVLLLLGIIGLFGFAALAIDGGMLYADRRHAQNSADTSALAAAAKLTKYFTDNGVTYSHWGTANQCGGWVGGAATLAQNEAIALAASNGYTLDTDISDNHGVGVTCSNISRGPFYDRYIDIITRITRETPTAFAHFIYPGPLVNTVEAIARIYPQIPLAYGHAIVALDPAPCSGNKTGMQIGGSSTTTINGGGIFSNGCLGTNGNDFRTVVNNGNIIYVGWVEGSETMDPENMDPTPMQTTLGIPEEAWKIPVPNCNALPVQTEPPGNNDKTLQPGRYLSTLSWNNNTLTLLPGLYCFYGSPNAIVINGGAVSANGVTIYLVNAGMSISGNVNPTSLSAATGSTAVNGAIPGLLIYLNPSIPASANTAIDLTGNNSSFYLGTILAPTGDVKITGANGTFPTFNTQIIGYDAFISGNATIDINFNDNENYQIPPAVNLQQ